MYTIVTYYKNGSRRISEIRAEDPSLLLHLLVEQALTRTRRIHAYSVIEPVN